MECARWSGQRAGRLTLETVVVNGNRRVKNQLKTGVGTQSNQREIVTNPRLWAR